MDLLKTFALVAGVLLLQACKHPLAIVGEGDIVDANNSGHGCTLEQFQAADVACTENEVTSSYDVNYKAEPREGWRFVRWEGPCAQASDFQHCHVESDEDWVAWTDENYPDYEFPASTAVFEPITGETGYLVEGPVAGVAYETPTQRGVTGVDGSFHYQPGEKVRFSIGATVLGGVAGAEQVTPFDLAGSPVLTGHRVVEGFRGSGEEPFQSVINIARLLQSFDRDADPTNGIEITQAVAALFDSVKLDVTHEWDDFDDQPLLNHIIGRANRYDRFSTTHGLVNPAVAMNHLYTSMGIDEPTVAPAREENIDPDSGEVTEFTRFDYDAWGNLVLREDIGRNRFERTIETRRFDEQGNLISQETESIHPPETNSDASSYFYDALGNLVLLEEDGGGDGTVDRRVSHTYDAGNHLVRSVEDANAEGMPERTDSWQYDAMGRPIHYELFCEKTPPDDPFPFPFPISCLGYDVSPIPDHSVDYSYDVNNNLVRTDKLSDEDFDGTPDQREITEYDAMGHQIRQVTDSDLDGVSDLEWLWTVTEVHDDAGNLVSRTETLDENGDGKPERIETTDYDPDGKPIAISYDADGDGRPERTETIYYDASGNEIRTEEDDDADGTLDEITTYEYDNRGNLVRRVVDEPADGEADRIDTWQYDAEGDLVRMEEDQGADGTADYFDYVEQDENGNLVRYRWDDDDFDGIGDFEEISRYDAMGNLLYRAEEHSYSGELERRAWTYEYDARGYLLSEAIEEARDGELVIQSRSYFQPAGWGHHFQDNGWIPDSLGL